MRVVTSSSPLKVTKLPSSMPVPVTVRVTLGEPTLAAAGDTAVIVAWLSLTVKITFVEVPPPGSGSDDGDLVGAAGDDEAGGGCGRRAGRSSVNVVGRRQTVEVDGGGLRELPALRGELHVGASRRSAQR